MLSPEVEEETTSGSRWLLIPNNLLNNHLRPSSDTDAKDTNTHTHIYIQMDIYLGFLGGSVVKNSSANTGDSDSVPGSGRSLEKEMKTHACILIWRIPWTEERGRLQSIDHKKLDKTCN